jgi:hypothetical protein
MGLAASRNSLATPILDLSFSLLGFVGSVGTVWIAFMGPLIDISGAPLSITYIIFLLPPVLLFSLVGLIHGWFSLDRLRKSGQRGRSLARCAIVLACLPLLVWLAWLPAFFHD